MIRLRYGNTCTFYIPGDRGGLLVDTDYAGTLPAFYKAIKAGGIGIADITRVMATHYHPDHMGLIGELMKQGVKLLLTEEQAGWVHFSDGIFFRERHPGYTPVDETKADILRCSDSRAFLAGLGIRGEIISTPSHSPDSVTLVLDCGDCIAGDLEPFEYLDAYEDNQALQQDWEKIRGFSPKRVFFSHRPEIRLPDSA